MRDHVQPAMTAGQLREILDGVDDNAPVLNVLEGDVLVSAVSRDGRVELALDTDNGVIP